jgi:hypothetical protein
MTTQNTVAKGLESNIGITNSVRTVVSAPPVPVQVAEQVEAQDGAKAIEVAAVFDDAVMAVRHFDNPKAGRMSRMTKGLLGSATLAFLSVGALFADSYSHVVAEKTAAEAGQPTLRATAQQAAGHARDAAAGGLLFYGLGALLFGLHRASSERKDNEFTIGSDAQATFHVEAERLPLVRFPILRSTGNGYEALFSDGMQGELQAQGKSTTLHELRESNAARPADDVQGAFALNLPEGGQLRLQHAGCTFLLRSVNRPRHYPAPMRFDWRAQSYTAGVLLGAATLLGIMFSVPPDPRSLALDAFSNDHLVRFMVKPPEQKEEEPAWLKQEKQIKAERSGGQAAKGATGKMGKPDAQVRPRAAYAVQGPKNNPDPKMKADLAKAAAAQSGVLGILRGGSLLALNSVLKAESGLGRDAVDALAGLDGTDHTDAYGPGGMGIVGVGPGADGRGDGTIGLGNIGTIGRSGGQPGYGKPGIAKLVDHRAKTPDWTVGQPQVIGSLDKELIRRVIRQHMNEVKFCYERELTRDTSLNGRVVVKFAIGGMGQVMTSAIESSTLANHNGERCIADAVRRWQFSKPQGGLVIVSYPFVLKHAE